MDLHSKMTMYVTSTMTSPVTKTVKTSKLLRLNKQGQWTMKTAIKIFFPFSCFRIEGRKQHNSDFQSQFCKSKIGETFLIFFH